MVAIPVTTTKMVVQRLRKRASAGILYIAYIGIMYKIIAINGPPMDSIRDKIDGLAIAASQAVNKMKALTTMVMVAADIFDVTPGASFLTMKRAPSAAPNAWPKKEDTMAKIATMGESKAITGTPV